MSQECKNYLDAWRRWQEARTEPYKVLPAELREAIDHIADCPACFEEVSRLTFTLLLEPGNQKKQVGLAEFCESVRQDGIESAVLGHPDMAHFLINDRSAFARFLVYSGAEADFSRLSLPPDVNYTITRYQTAAEWVSLFGKHFGIGEKGLSQQAKATLEFRLDRATGSASVSLRMVEIVTEKGQVSQVQMKDDAMPSKGGTKLITLTTDICNATVRIVPGKGYLSVLIPYHKAARIPPIIALIREDGKATVRQASETKGYYEASFSGISTGDYLLAVDITEKLKSRKQPFPVELMREPYRKPEKPEMPGSRDLE